MARIIAKLAAKYRVLAFFVNESGRKRQPEAAGRAVLHKV
jgi:hypothetical protein